MSSYISEFTGSQIDAGIKKINNLKIDEYYKKDEVDEIINEVKRIDYITFEVISD